jgi:hypothetical protein
MNSQRKKLVQSELNVFLQDINYNNVYLLPCNNNPRLLAAQETRRFQSFQKLKGIDLMKDNVELEAKRLNINIHDSTYLINSAVKNIWNLRTNYRQRQNFEALAAEANKINQKRSCRIRVDDNDTITRMTRLDNPQETTNNPIVDGFYRGTSDFNNKDAFESLMLPAGFGGSSTGFS